MWYYIPPTTSRSVQELEGLTLQSNSPFHSPGAFVMSNGKPSPQQYSWRGWKTRPWIKHLYGLTLPHSIANRGVAAWILWLRDSRASRSVSPGKEKETKTSDGCGKMLSVWFAKWEPSGSSWKTSQESFLWGSETFSETWPKAGSMQNGFAYRQAEWEAPIKETDGSAWATPTSRDWKDGSDTKTPVNSYLGRQVVRFFHRHPVHQTGKESRPKLNPLFVEKLMGLPHGWTDFAPLETESYLRRLRSQFESYWAA